LPILIGQIMNETLFYNSVRKVFFKGKISTGAFNTIQKILSECRERKVYDYRHIAYILATGYYESYHATKNPNWDPIREGWAKTNQGAIAAVKSLYNKGGIPVDYAIPKSNGLSYYGRGWVQLTWEQNYIEAGRLYGINLHKNPDLALDRNIAALLLVGGMAEGWFTGVSLSDYITTQNTDFLNARRVVNGKDRAKLISDYAHNFYNAMIQL